MLKKSQEKCSVLGELIGGKGMVIIHFADRQQEGKPTLLETGVLLKWTATDGVQRQERSTFIFYDAITAVSY